MAKKNLSKYIDVIDFYIDGIPCLIGVETCNIVKGSFSYNAPSDVDYYGYDEVEYEVLDRKGYVAGKWLTSKIDADTEAEIHQAIIDNCAETADDWY